VVQQLRNDAQASRCHLALYLCCQQTLRAHRERIARRQQIGGSIRWFFRSIVSTPAAIVRKLPGQNEARLGEPIPQFNTPTAVQRVVRLPDRINLGQEAPWHFEPAGACTEETAPGPRVGEARRPRDCQDIHHNQLMQIVASLAT
jgi:hypothetical protein